MTYSLRRHIKGLINAVHVGSTQIWLHAITHRKLGGLGSGVAPKISLAEWVVN